MPSRRKSKSLVTKKGTQGNNTAKDVNGVAYAPFVSKSKSSTKRPDSLVTEIQRRATLKNAEEYAKHGPVKVLWKDGKPVKEE